MPELFTELTH